MCKLEHIYGCVVLMSGWTLPRAWLLTMLYGCDAMLPTVPIAYQSHSVY